MKAPSTAWSIAAATLFCAVPAACEAEATAAAPHFSADEDAAVWQLFERINEAWKTDPAVARRLEREALSDDGFVVAMAWARDPSKVTICDKETFCRVQAQEMQAVEPGQVDHDVQSVTVVGPLAYAIGTTSFTEKPGHVRRIETVNFLARGQVGWRIVSSAPLAHIRQALCATAQEAEAGPAIRQLVDMINRACSSAANAKLMREVLSDTGFAFAMPNPGNAAEAWIANKESFCDAFETAMASDPPRDHRHEISAIAAFGGLAYEVGTASYVPADGARRLASILNVFAHDGSGWRLVFSADPDNVRQAVESADAAVARQRDLVGNALEAKSRGEFGKAIRLLEDGLKSGPDTASAYHVLGWLYVKTDRADEAIAAFERVVALEPESDEAKDARAALTRIRAN